MSSMSGNSCCSECKSTNAYMENYSDDEIGKIQGCFDCGYYEVYRVELTDDYEEGEEIENYSGYKHSYREDDISEGRASKKNIKAWNLMKGETYE